MCYGESIVKWDKCLQCGKIHRPKVGGKRNKKFCSRKCFGEFKKGKPLSKKHRESLSKCKKGRPIKHFVENKEAIYRKISNTLRGRPQLWNRGKNHPNYVDGGKAAWARQKDMGRVEYKEWRRTVFHRDGYKCVLCGSCSEIQADHIKSYALFPELRLIVSNGRTLCKKCHRKTSNYGRRGVKNGKIHPPRMAQRETESIRLDSVS
jgi:hypothetical protein